MSATPKEEYYKLVAEVGGLCEAVAEFVEVGIVDIQHHEQIDNVMTQVAHLGKKAHAAFELGEQLKAIGAEDSVSKQVTKALGNLLQDFREHKWKMLFEKAKQHELQPLAQAIRKLNSGLEGPTKLFVEAPTWQG